jgi:hypothetical protein
MWKFPSAAAPNPERKPQSAANYNTNQNATIVVVTRSHSAPMRITWPTTKANPATLV